MSYRNDVEALEIRLAQLEGERAAFARDRARLEDSLRRMPKLDDELDRLRRELHARAPRKLPVLEDIRIASPCHARWDEMSGDEQARFCGSCKKNVYNLSSMTREAAEALVRGKEGDLCVRFYRRADGTVLTADCSVGVRRKRVQLVAAAGAVTALAAGAVAAAFAHMGAPVPPAMQGGISAAPTTTPPTLPPTTHADPPMQEIQGGIRPMMGQMPPPHVITRPRMGRPMLRHDR
ncbi:MAG: hypothetical protein JWM10_3676 [Myxococcaceae bacterium]|nr:hypothetical protein [Myxococcaceae bacterium]